MLKWYLLGIRAHRGQASSVVKSNKYSPARRFGALGAHVAKLIEAVMCRWLADKDNGSNEENAQAR